MKHEPALYNGLSDLLVYDAFLIDLWGVIYDGNTLYPTVKDTLERLKNAGKKICFLSNAPRAIPTLEHRLEGMGLTRDLYDALMCSGEAVRLEFLSLRDPFFKALGTQCYHLGPDKDHDLFQGLVLQRVPLQQAGFILNTGPVFDSETADDYATLLQEAKMLDLPMICANPDKVIVRDGKFIYCAGILAEAYEAIGGKVVYRGKPDPIIFAQSQACLGLDSAERIAMIGDSLTTDIAGANAAGLESILVCGGIHAEELGLMAENLDRRLPSETAVHTLCEQKGIWPTVVIPAFQW